VADSLVLAGRFELLGGGVASTIPACAGARFRLAPGFDLSMHQPTTALVASLVLDGERPVGDRSSNRAPVLPIAIFVPSTGNLQADRATLGAARETLIKAVNEPEFPLVWTRDGGLPLVLDCFRATAVVVDYSIVRDKALVSTVQVTCGASPFGRSDQPQVVDFQAALAGKSPPPAYVTLDDFASVSGSGWSGSLTGPGPQSAHWSPAGTGIGYAPALTRTVPQPLNANWDFETGTAPWTAIGSSTLSQSAAWAFSGSHCASFHGDGGTANPGMQSETFAVTALSTYTASAQLNAGSVGLWGLTTIAINWYTAGLVSISTSTSAVYGAGRTTSGILASVTDTAPATAAYARIVITMTFTPPAGTVLQVDNAMMVAGLYAAPCNLANLSAVTVWAGFGSTDFFWWARQLTGPASFTFTLTDNTGKSLSFSADASPTVSNNSSAPVWVKVRAAIPSPGAVNLSRVASYSVKITSRYGFDLPWTDLYLDSLWAVPASLPGSSAPVTGMVYDLAGMIGSARSPMSLQLQQPPGVLAWSTKRFTTPGVAYWLCPAGTYRVQRTECYGAGARGSRQPGGPGQGGGAGGGYGAEPGVPVTPGQAYPVSVPAGGSTGTGRAAAASFTGDGGYLVTSGTGPLNQPDGTAAGGAVGAAYVPQEQLTGQMGGFEGGIGTWVGATRCSVAANAAQHHSGAGCLAITCTTAGDMLAGSSNTPGILTQGEPCDPAFPVVVNGWLKAAATGRSCSVGAEFYDYYGVSLGDFYGGVTADVTTGWTQMTTATLTPPAGSVWCRAKVKVAAAALSEVHYADDVSLLTGVGHAGGGGAAGSGGSGGGGGGGGGPATPGGTPAGTAGGVGGGGHAGSGGSAAASGTAGKVAGGGGAGGGTSTYYGNGANGEVDLTWWQTPGFKTWVAHRPGRYAPDTLCPFVPLDTGDAPDGTTDYPVPSLVAGQAARFNSTYTPYLVACAWNNPSAARTVTVTVTLWEQSGGASYSQSVSRSVVPDNLDSPLVALDPLTIPDRPLAPDNLNAHYTVRVTSGLTADRFQDVLFLDTAGSTVIVESPTAYVGYWVDAPASGMDIGLVYGSMFDRADAVTVLEYATVSGPPLHLDPVGCQALMVYCADAGLNAPAVEMTYYPRWMTERLA
jgi:hypothetical protein